MRELKIYNRLIDVEAQASQALLRKAHSENMRPLCMCAPGGVPMYLASVNERIIVKRLPGSGEDHDPDCESYEPPSEVSGIAELQGRAIKENDEKGTKELRLDFPLKKTSGKAPPPSESSGGPESLKSDGGKLTMLGTLHYLWGEAGLNKWHPKMAGKRNWGLLRHLLLTAITAKSAKGLDLKTLLYIPETWREPEQDNLRARRLTLFRDISHTADKRHSPLGLILGEFKAIVPKGNTMRLTLKHAPDVPFLLPSDLHDKVSRRFSNLFSLREADENIHIVAFGTVSLDTMLVPSIEQITFMATNADWIPIDSPYESLLVNNLIRQERAFFKGLRYNLPTDAPIASAVLTDTSWPTSCFLIDNFATDSLRAQQQRVIEGSSYPVWTWNLNSPEIPPLPPPAPRATTAYHRPTAPRQEQSPKPEPAMQAHEDSPIPRARPELPQKEVDPEVVRGLEALVQTKDQTKAFGQPHQMPPVTTPPSATPPSSAEDTAEDEPLGLF